MCIRGEKGDTPRPTRLKGTATCSIRPFVSGSYLEIVLENYLESLLVGKT